MRDQDNNAQDSQYKRQKKRNVAKAHRPLNKKMTIQRSSSSSNDSKKSDSDSDSSEDDSNTSRGQNSDEGSEESSSVESGVSREEWDESDSSEKKKPKKKSKANNLQSQMAASRQLQAKKKVFQAPNPAKTEQKILEDNQLTRPITQELTEKIENLISAFDKDAAITRPYCNEVTVKVSRS